MQVVKELLKVKHIGWSIWRLGSRSIPFCILLDLQMVIRNFEHFSRNKQRGWGSDVNEHDAFARRAMAVRPNLLERQLLTFNLN